MLSPDKAVEIPNTIKNPWGVFSKGKETFMPKKLATMVGRETTIVIAAKNFMTMVKLLEMIEANDDIVLLKILL